ncbi:hypothetical protein ABDK09_15740 [Vibrio sp. CDRSL-10 TSBA]
MNSFIAGSKNSDQSRVDLWNSVVFYNYLQVAAGEDARQTQYYDYTESKHKAALLEVIEELQPEFIISWGNKAWDAVPADFGYGKYHLSSTHEHCCCIYPFKDREIKLIGTTHPSTAYRSSYWSNIFHELGVNG